MSAALAAAAGLQLAAGINTAFQEQAFAQLQSFNIKRQMDEIEDRTNIEIGKINQKAEKVVASQTAAYISSGVELSGSAMSIVSDTLSDAAQETFMRQRETDYTLMSMGMEKHQMDKMGSNEAMLMKIGTSAIGAGTSYAGAKYGK